MSGLFFTGVSVVGQIMAGIGAQREAELNVFNMETSKKLDQVEAMQVAAARKEEFDFATSANIAALAATGRDIGDSYAIPGKGKESVDAFLSKQKDVAFDDLTKIQKQSYLNDLRAEMEKGAERRRGKNARTSSLFRAMGTLGEGLSSAKDVKGGGKSLWL
tara:strand:+ start:3034 stop:3516 length:483 start_codon:yes stop_codon:yes gene_type:complete